MCLFRMFEHINERWGELIATYPKHHIFISLTIITLFAINLKDIRVENDIRTSFSPLNSRSSYEYAVYKEFFNLTVFPERSSILFSAKDHGSMLRLEPLEEVLELNSKYLSILKELDPVTGLSGCHPQCDLNLPFSLIANELIKLYKLERQKASNHTNQTVIVNDDSLQFLLDYPMANLFGASIFMGMNLINCQVSNEVFTVNNSKVVSAKKIILWYFARADTPVLKERMRNASLELFEAGKTGKMFKHVDFKIFGDEIANTEMVRGAVEATVLMSIGFGLLFVFVFCSVHGKMRKVPRHRIFFVICASIFSPVMSSAAAFGLLIWFGSDIYTIMCVTPFLICGIGVDNAFIMLHSWKHYSKMGLCQKKQLSIVLVHAGPSIAITSLTNTVAFGIGYATPTPQMSLFCLCTSIAVFLNYMLTLTFLAPTIVLALPNNENQLATSIKHDNNEIDAILPQNDSDKSCVISPNNKVIIKENITIGYNPTEIPTAIEHYFNNNKPIDVHRISPRIYSYAEFINSSLGRVFSYSLMLVLLVISSFGIARMKSTFEPSKAFPSNSQLSTSLGEIKGVFDEFFPVNFFVNRPPNISNPIEYQNFYQMVNELESLPESYGKDRTLLWLRAYEEFDQKTSNLWDLFGIFKSENNSAIAYQPSFDNLDYFLRQLNFPSGIKTSVNEHGVRQLKAFQFAIVAKNMSEWLNRAIIEQKCREILMKYPDFNTTIYDGDAAVLNLLLTAKLDLIGSIMVTIACMVVICSFFIAHQTGVIAIALTITSICYMLVGMMSWWGADLDPVTIVDVLLATGFSVDCTAHIAHQFYAPIEASSCNRIALALQTMFIPTLEASTSTLLCMLPLFFVPTYAIVAFAKTIFVVIAVGLLHGLLFMPTMLCSIPLENRQKSSWQISNCFRKNRGHVEKKGDLSLFVGSPSHNLMATQSTVTATKAHESTSIENLKTVIVDG